jgi:transcriptional regulator with XRE-family HTH domain
MNRDFDKKVGAIIKEKRREKRLTQVQLAERLSIGKSTLACYETGARGMDLDTFFEICRILEVNPNDIQSQL